MTSNLFKMPYNKPTVHYIKLCPPYNREGIEFFTNPSYIYYVFNDSSSKQKASYRAN